MTPLPEKTGQALPRRLAVAVFAACMILYVFTLCPTYSWGDSADLPIRIWQGEPITSYVRGYPIYREVGWLFARLPIGDIAYRINFMTAVFGSLTAAVVAIIVWLRVRSMIAAVGAALSLAVSHCFWLLSVTAEVYTMATFLNAVLLLTAFRYEQQRRPKHLYLLAFLAGLCLSHHRSSALILPPLVLFLFKFREWRNARTTTLMVLSGVAGLSHLIVGFANSIVIVGFREAWRVTSQSTGMVKPSALLSELARCGAFWLYQFPGLGALLMVAGVRFLARERRSPWDTLLLLSPSLLIAWATLTSIPDKHNAWVLVNPYSSILIGLGITATMAWARRKALRLRLVGPVLIALLAFVPVALYVVTPAIASRQGVNLLGARKCPNRDNNWYFLFPGKRGDDGARRYAEAALRAAPVRATLIADYTLLRVLGYAQSVDGIRPDVDLAFVEPLLVGDRIVSFINRELKERPVYLAAAQPRAYYHLDAVEQFYEVVPEGPIFRAVRRTDTTNATSLAPQDLSR